MLVGNKDQSPPKKLKSLDFKKCRLTGRACPSSISRSNREDGNNDGQNMWMAAKTITQSVLF